MWLKFLSLCVLSTVTVVVATEELCADYCESYVNESVEAVRSYLEDKIEQLEQEKTKLKGLLDASEQSRFQLIGSRRERKPVSVLQQDSKDSKWCIGMVFDGICFFAELHTTYDIKLPQAEEICAEKGLTLGDIYSEEQYNAVVKYIRSIMPKIPFVGIWNGMSSDESKNVTLSDGSPAPFVTWFPGRPLSDPTASKINFRVPLDDNAYLQGMYDHYPYWEDYGVLCQGY